MPKQVQEILNEDVQFGKRMTSRRAEEDASCYYMNANFKNVFSSKYCIKTCEKEVLNQNAFLGHSLPKSEAKHFCTVEGKNGSYYNIRIQQAHLTDQVEMQMYYRSKSFYVFLFTLVNETEKFDRKQTFFFLKKSYRDVEELSQDNHQSLIQMDQDVTIIKDNDLLGNDEVIFQKYTQVVTFRELVELQHGKQDHHIHWSFETLYDMRQNIEFLPFIYQEKKTLASHHLLVLDVNTMTIIAKTCINSNLNIRKFLRYSEAGYAMYSLTRTSDLFDQKLGFFDRIGGQGGDACSQVVKYQISHQYYLDDSEEQLNPASCTIELSEYCVHYNNFANTKIQLIGRKQLLLSDVAQYTR